MEQVHQVFRSHEEAEKANRAYIESLTGQQRLEILLELLASQRTDDEAANRLACVCRMFKRGEG